MNTYFLENYIGWLTLEVKENSEEILFVILRLNKYKLLNIFIYRNSEILETDKNSE